jgi:hypothetical protein
MGLQITVSGLGWITASTLGGWLVVAYGFGSLGLLAAACGAGSATFAALAGLFAAPPIRGQSRPGRSAAATS